jgi:hypothetical protein
MGEQKTCSKCNLTQPEQDFSPGYSVCKECQKDQRSQYELGINADLSKVAPASRQDILGARELLVLMGYDLNKPIYEQFKRRALRKWGVVLETGIKRSGRPKKRLD